MRKSRRFRTEHAKGGQADETRPRVTNPRAVFQVCAQRCDECLFSSRKIVSDERKADVLAEAADTDQHFVCHKHTWRRIEGFATDEEANVCCRGFFDRYPHETLPMRLAAMLGLVVFVDHDGRLVEATTPRTKELAMSQPRTDPTALPELLEWEPDTGTILNQQAVIGRVFLLDDYPCLDTDEHDLDAIEAEIRGYAALFTASPRLLAVVRAQRARLALVQENIPSDWRDPLGEIIAALDEVIADATREMPEE